MSEAQENNELEQNEQNIEQNEELNETSTSEETTSEVVEENNSEETVEVKAEEAEKTESETTAEVDDKNLPKVLSDEEKAAIVEELKSLESSGSSFNVNVLSKTRGGFRVSYKEFPLFLPISHFSLKRSPSDSETEGLENTEIEVKVLEIKDESGIPSIVVTRKAILEAAIWNNLKVGEKVEGTVTSTPAFGAFVDLGGVEGLIHVSRLSKARIEHPKDFVKKGDKIEVLIIDLDKENNKISLSRKELEPSPWEGAEEAFPENSQQKGIVRRLTEFGAYVELKPGVDGLLRNGEISWTKRVSDPSQILKPGDKIDVQIMKISTEKGIASLSMKRLVENPWSVLQERYPINSVYHAKAIDVNQKGAVFALNDEVDGFMPKSKMKPIMKGSKMPFEKGEKVEVVVTEIDPSTESLILAPKLSEEQIKVQEERQASRANQANYKKKGDSTFTFGDMLGEKVFDKLNDLKD